MKYKFRGHVVDMADIDSLIQTAKDRMKGYAPCLICSKYWQCINCPVYKLSGGCNTKSWVGKMINANIEDQTRLLIQRKKYWQRIAREILEKGELIK